MAAALEKVGHDLMDFEFGTTAEGIEFIKFDCEAMVVAVLKAHDLYNLSKVRSVTIAISIDGALITKNLSHVCMGFKINDIAAICPLTGKPIILNVQSRNLCFPLKIVMSRETKNIYDLFTDEFGFLQSISADNNQPLPNPMVTKHGCKAFTVSVNTDLSATWKGLKIGGAAKVKKHPCHCCAVHSDTIENPNSILCDWLCSERRGDPNWRCFHREMLTPGTLDKLEAEVEALASLAPGNLEERVATLTKINCDEDPQIPTSTAITNFNSIHYQPGTRSEKGAWLDFISDEMNIRGLDVDEEMSLSERREALRTELLVQYRMDLIRTSLTHGRKQEGAVFYLLQCVPCGLHMENRIGLKMIMLALDDGLENALAGKVYADIPANHNRKIFNKFVQDVEHLFNKELLGDQNNPTQWSCPHDPATQQITEITLDNNRTRKIVDRFKELVRLCIVDADKRALWILSVSEYRKGYEILRKKEDLTDDDIEQMQRHFDEFYQIWVRDLHSRAGVTNYIHMIGAGHVAEYAYHWRNLYRHSQQGWEAFNSMLKTFFHRRTNRGGRSGHNNEYARSRLRDIGRWLLRRTLWLCGWDKEKVEDYNRDRNRIGGGDEVIEHAPAEQRRIEMSVGRSSAEQRPIEMSEMI